MSFVTIAGADYEVTTDGASELDPIEIGARVRAYAGNQRSTVRGVIRGWQMTVLFMGGLTEEETLRTATQLGQHVTCTGDALKGVSATCEVTVGSVQMIPAIDATYGHWRGASVTIRRVAPVP